MYLTDVDSTATISKRVVSQDAELWQTGTSTICIIKNLILTKYAVVMLNKSQALETKRYMMRAIANLAVNGKPIGTPRLFIK